MQSSIIFYTFFSGAAEKNLQFLTLYFIYILSGAAGKKLQSPIHILYTLSDTIGKNYLCFKYTLYGAAGENFTFFPAF